MSYTPKVGDRVRQPHWATSTKVDVTAVGLRHFLGTYPDGTESAFGLDPTDEWVKVEPRPTIAAEQWGYIARDLFWTAETEHHARQASGDHRILARIINGRVCDEHGEPFEVRS